MTRRRTSDCAGFTLVEAMMATLLMSIILFILATITAQWLPNWDRGFGRLQRADALAVGLDRLADDLAAAAFVSAGPGDQRPIFAGGELSVVFVRSTLSPNGTAGIELVRIAETNDTLGPVLTRSTAPLPLGVGGTFDAEGIAFANPVVMIRAPYRVSFAYAGPDRVWRESWRDQVALPSAVRLSLRDNATSALLSVSTSTLVHAQLPARCTWATSPADCPFIDADALSGNGGFGGR